MARKPERKRKRSKLPRMEDRYRKLFRSPSSDRNDSESLQQPTIYKTVDTVTTYGAYQEPV